MDLLLTIGNGITGLLGANGAGKTRFVNKLVEQCGDQAFRISALRALFPVEHEEQKYKGSISERFDKLNQNMQQVVNTAKSEFDKLSYVMMIDEFRSLMNFKAHQLMKEDMEFLEETIVIGYGVPKPLFIPLSCRPCGT